MFDLLLTATYGSEFQPQVEYTYTMHLPVIESASQK